MIALLTCVSLTMASDSFLNCTTVDTTLTTTDTSVSVSCASIVLSNVVMRGNMTLSINIAGIARANPTVGEVMITLRNVTVEAGATLAIDRSTHTAGEGAGVPPTVSIVIHSLVGTDGCFLISGPFPPRSTLVVNGAHMTSTGSIGPTHADLDPSDPDRPKLALVANLSLDDSSSLIFANSSFMTGNSSIPMLITGAAAASISTNSMLVFRNCSFLTAEGDAITLYSALRVTGNSSLTVSWCTMTSSSSGGSGFHINSALFTNNSVLTVASCNMTTYGDVLVVISANFAQWSSLVVSSSGLTAFSPGASAIYMPGARFTDFSSMLVTSSNVTSLSSSGGDALYMRSPSFTNYSSMIVTFTSMTSAIGTAFNLFAPMFTNSSVMKVITSTVISPEGSSAFNVISATFTHRSSMEVRSSNATAPGGYAFSISAAFVNFSSMVVASSTMRSFNEAFYVDRTLTLDVWSYMVVLNNTLTSTCAGNSAVSLGTISVGDSSLALWKGNVMRSLPTDCITGGINFSTTPAANRGTISILENTCSCGSGCAMWATSSVSGGAEGEVYQRCNTINGVAIPPGSALLPTAAIAAGACGSCNVSCDCFGPLTANSSTCSIFAPSVSSVAACQCLQGGLSRSMCLPLATAPSWLTTAAPTTRAPATSAVPSSASEGPKTSTGTALASCSRTLSAPTISPSCDVIPAVAADASLVLLVSSHSVGGPAHLDGSTVPVVSFILAMGLELTISAAPGVSWTQCGNSSDTIGGSGSVASGEAKTIVLVSRETGSQLAGVLSLVDSTTLVIVVDVAAAGPCLPLGFRKHINFSWTLGPAPPPSALHTATTAAFRASAVTSSLLGNPLAAMSTTSMISILSLEECLFSDVDPLDPSVSPLGVSLGQELGQYYRGGAAAAILLYSIITVLATGGAGVISVTTKCPLILPLARLHFPSVGMIAVALFGQGLASCGMSLIRLGDNTGDVVLGVVALASCLLLATGATYNQRVRVRDGGGVGKAARHSRGAAASCSSVPAPIHVGHALAG